MPSPSRAPRAALGPFFEGFRDDRLTLTLGDEGIRYSLFAGLFVQLAALTGLVRPLARDFARANECSGEAFPQSEVLARCT